MQKSVQRESDNMNSELCGYNLRNKKEKEVVATQVLRAAVKQNSTHVPLHCLVALKAKRRVVTSASASPSFVASVSGMIMSTFARINVRVNGPMCADSSSLRTPIRNGSYVSTVHVRFIAKSWGSRQQDQTRVHVPSRA